MKRLLSFFLALIMVVALIPVSARAEELPQLDAPTDLEWHYTSDGDYCPGFIYFRAGALHQQRYIMEVWQVGADYPFWTFYGLLDESKEVVYDDYLARRMDLPNGEYYFKVCMEGDGINYRDSEFVTSDVWSYKTPVSSIAKAENLSWDGIYLSYVSPVDETYIYGYHVDIYFSESPSDNPEWIQGTYNFDKDSKYLDYSYEHARSTFKDSYDSITQKYGVGYYYYSVHFISSDITKFRHSHSELSPAYYVDEVNPSVSYQLNEMANNVANLSAEEIRSKVQGMDTALLRDEMDSDFSLSNLATLEEAVGGAADVVIADPDSPFTADKVSIIGANLNTPSSGSNISLVIDKPEKDHVMDTMYNNSVAVKFSMDLENVSDSKNLEVPVQITLPVPANINPDFLLVLHYNADGTIEEIFPRIKTEDGINYASFIVTNFSDFVLTEFVLEEPEPTEPTPTEPVPTEPEPTEPPATEPPATEPPVVLPTITGTYTTDLIMSAADLGVSAPDSVLQATLTFTDDGKASAAWEAVDLTAFKVFFHDMFVNAYYAMAYGAGITDINEIEQFCIDSTGMSVSAYMDTIVTDEAMKAAFTPASTQGSYRYAPENKAIFTDLALMDVPSDPTVPNSFSVENGTMYLNAASWGKSDYTFVCKK